MVFFGYYLLINQLQSAGSNLLAKIKMQLKSRIKSMTQYPLKGARIFPIQLFTTDANKSIRLEGIGQKSFERVNQGNHVLTPPQHHPEGLRLNHRHSIEIGGYQRCHTARPSQDFGRFSLALENARISERDESLSMRPHLLQNYSEVRESERLSKFSEEDQPFPTIKATVTHTIRDVVERPPKIQENHFEKIKMDTILKQVQQQKTRTDNEEQSMEKVYKKLYIQYRNRYERAQTDNSEIMERFRKVDNLVEELEREKVKLEQEVRVRSVEGGKVKELEEKVVRLEDSIKINRKINDVLMRKEKDYEKKVKELEQIQAGKEQKINNMKQEMERLSVQYKKFKEQNMHLDNENLRLDSENVRLSTLYEQLSKECQKHSTKEDLLEISERLDKIVTDKYLLEQSNDELQRTLLQFTQHNSAAQDRISWLQSSHKQLESNLMETQEELMRVGLQFLNYKLSQQYQKKSQQQQQSSNCTPEFDRIENQQKLSLFQANTNHLISSDSDDDKPHQLPAKSNILSHQQPIEDKDSLSLPHSLIPQSLVYSIA